MGSYQLHERVGEGGSAQVYRAVSADGETVAVKLLSPSADLDDTSARARFEREIRVLADLDHPGLVRLYDSGVDDELGPYLVTAFVAGTTLRELLDGARVCPEAALLLVAPIARAVVALHEAGLVHRDLKPENVMVTPDGRVVVVDLGLAYRAGQTRYTGEGEVVGSIPYMAPEQLEGDELTPATDVWPLGVMMYEWIAGTRPFSRARAAEEAGAALIGAHTPLDAADRKVEPSLAALVSSCLARDPAARPAADALAREIAARIDWCARDRHDAERAAVVADPAGYTARVARARCDRLASRAREELAAGEPFRALELIDRGLAYDAEHAALLALAADAQRSAPERTAAEDAPAARPRSRTAALAVGALVIVAGVAAGLGVLFRGSGDGDERAATAETAPETPRSDVIVTRAADDDPAWELARGMIDLFEKGFAAAEEGDRAAATSAELDLRPIPAEALPGAGDPHRLDELAAAAGEPLVPPDRLGGRDPSELLAELEARGGDGPDARLGRALVTLAAGDADAGLAALDAVVTDHPSFAAAAAARGYVAMRRGAWDQAMTDLDRALELAPGDRDALRNRGILAHRLGRTRDAYRDLTDVITRWPDDIDAAAELAQLYHRAGRTADALPLLEKVVAARPASADALLDLSLAQSPREALKSIDAAVERAPDSARAHLRRCAVLAQRGDDDADAACTRALELAPASSRAHLHRGLARYRAGDDPAALADLDRAVELAPDDPSVYVNRSLVRARAGDHGGARADLRRACDLGARTACN